MFQFTHPVWGATLREMNDTNTILSVSIHAPRVGCDTKGWAKELDNFQFQFTHPVWGATYLKKLVPEIWRVSIHAPRVGCD